MLFWNCYTSCYCVFEIDIKNKSIRLAEKPKIFSISNSNKILKELFEKYKNFIVIAIDAPLTPKIKDNERQSTRGRQIDKLFSRGKFNNSQKGPQPGSILVPKQGWPLYKAGMEFKNLVEKTGHNIGYINFNEFNDNFQSGIIEVIPKLTLSLLVERDILVNRKKNQIDNYLFPILFNKRKFIIHGTLNGYKFSEKIDKLIDEICQNPKKYHEELAAFIAAYQAFLYFTKNATIVGKDGEDEGYFVLPKYEFWDKEWSEAFNKINKDSCIKIEMK